MACSPDERALRSLKAVDDMLARATQAFAAGDLDATSAAIECIDTLLDAIEIGDHQGRVAEDAWTKLRARHSSLLAAVVGERDRTALELSRVRTGQRALRPYRRRGPTDAGHSA